jgi:flavin reductase (DIM6/NTAB) family NADH-FMN oxidoreductase RutF
MSKQVWKPGTLVYPLPTVMISCGDMEKSNILTVAWTGTICTDPAMTYISIRPERYSYDIIKSSKEFVINLTTKDLAYATDWCGVRSGKDYDKFKEMKLNKEYIDDFPIPVIKESPVNILCKVRQIVELGSHDMFISDVINVIVDKELLDDKGTLDLNKAKLISYSHGRYYSLEEPLLRFGGSVKKKK